MNTETQEKPKSLWGYGITIVYACFMAMILSIVFLSTGEKMDLVTDNYYNEGLDYQQVIDSRQQANALVAKPKFYQNKMQILIPNELRQDFLHGEVKLFRPSDAILDQTLSIKLNKEGTFNLPEIKKGAWQIYLMWEDQEKQEYQMQWNIFK